MFLKNGGDMYKKALMLSLALLLPLFHGYCKPKTEKLILNIPGNEMSTTSNKMVTVKRDKKSIKVDFPGLKIYKILIHYEIPANTPLIRGAAFTAKQNRFQKVRNIRIYNKKNATATRRVQISLAKENLNSALPLFVEIPAEVAATGVTLVVVDDPNYVASPAASAFSITSPAFSEGGIIPEEYTCQGGSGNPEINIHNAPQGTKSFALVVSDDKDLDWYWTIYGIPGSETRIPKSTDKWYRANYEVWQAPCRVPSGLHPFTFTLYALNTTLHPSHLSVSSLSDAVDSLKGKILGKATLKANYKINNPLSLECKGVGDEVQVNRSGNPITLQTNFGAPLDKNEYGVKVMKEGSVIYVNVPEGVLIKDIAINWATPPQNESPSITQYQFALEYRRTNRVLHSVPKEYLRGSGGVRQMTTSFAIPTTGVLLASGYRYYTFKVPKGIRVKKVDLLF